MQKQINISKVAEDIIKIKFKRSDTLSSCLKKFYDVMRKHGIKQGTPTCNDEGEEVGRIVANFEWTMCYALFVKHITDFFTWEDIFSTKIPEDLLK
jgi:hypothetical protein